MNPDHPDAQQDAQQMGQDLAPVFQEIGRRLSDLEDIVFKMVVAFDDAVRQNRMGGLKSGLREKYGPDLDTYGPVFTDFYGKDLTESLLEALGDGADLDRAGQMLDELKAKFGKYVQPSAPATEAPAVTEVEISAEPAEGEPAEIEAPAASGEPSDKPEEKAEAPSEEKKEEGPVDPISKLMKDVRTMRGRKTA